MMNNRPLGSFDILDLFPEPLELGFHLNDEFRNHAAIGLRADRVDLAVHLLKKKVELAPAGLAAAGQIIPMSQVALEPSHLFADVRSLRDAHDLLRHQSMVDGNRARQLARTLEQPALELPSSGLSGFDHAAGEVG